jgi:hypothetical protein
MMRGFWRVLFVIGDSWLVFSREDKARRKSFCKEMGKMGWKDIFTMDEMDLDSRMECNIFVW